MQNTKKFIVYEHLFPNGKRYIGITSKEPNRRWENGSGYAKNQSVIYNAIKKYGWENIEHNILYEGLTQEEAQEKEKELIQYYRTFIRFDDCNGYNMTLGGEGTIGHKVSENVRIASRQRLLGKTGELCVNSIKVICDNIIYPSITDFANKNGITSSATICDWLKGKKGMPKHFYDLGLRYYDDDLYLKYKDKIHIADTKSQRTPIQYDGKIFSSQAEFAKYIEVAPSLVTLWLNGSASIPKEILDNGFKCDKDISKLKIGNKRLKTKVEYDGKIYNSQAELARVLEINKSTLNAWLCGKNKMPQFYKDKGLKKL